MSRTIALVDDDRNILTSVAIALENEGFRVRSYTDGASALEALGNHPADLALLDIKMPRLDGLETLKRLRQTSDMPVIFLTSKDGEEDEMEGLKLGADDYVKKPFSQRLLMERVKAVLRRYETANANATDDEDEDFGRKKTLVRGDLLLDESRHLCSWKGQPVPLTVTEFLLVQTLANRPGHVKNRDQLMDAAYGDDVYVDDRTIDSHIKRLRKKFRKIDSEFNAIETLYGIGYKYNAD